MIFRRKKTQIKPSPIIRLEGYVEKTGSWYHGGKGDLRSARITFKTDTLFCKTKVELFLFPAETVLNSLYYYVHNTKTSPEYQRFSGYNILNFGYTYNIHNKIIYDYVAFDIIY